MIILHIFHKNNFIYQATQILLHFNNIIHNILKIHNKNKMYYKNNKNKIISKKGHCHKFQLKNRLQKVQQNLNSPNALNFSIVP